VDKNIKNINNIGKTFKNKDKNLWINKNNDKNS
jgi:hypothetical protein